MSRSDFSPADPESSSADSGAAPADSKSPPADVLHLESSLEALQESPEFRGPVEPMNGRNCNDHFALIYESREEQLAAAIPFLRQGLERGERCIYVIDEEAAVPQIRAAMIDAGIDVDARVEAGQLSFELVADTYLRGGTFDPDEMLAFYAELIEEATAEWNALRISAETSWLEHERTDVEDFMAYEAKVNRLFDDTDAIALCQYDRRAFEPEVVRDIVRTHPHLIYEGTVCHNFYHTPPKDYFAPEQPDREVDRMLATLVDRTEAKAELQERQRFLQRAYQITSNPALSFDDKLERLLELGRELFDLEAGCLTSLSSWDGDFHVEKAVGDARLPEHGSLPVDHEEARFCRHVVTEGGTLAVRDVTETSWDDDPFHRELGFSSYLGTCVTVGRRTYGTLWFGDEEPREAPFTDGERTFLELVGQWVSYELERDVRERHLRRQNDVISSPDREFEAKLTELLELGCENFEMDVGAMARVDPEADTFEVEYTSRDHEHMEPGLELPLTETLCTAATEADDVSSVPDATEHGYEDVHVHRAFGLTSYLGTHLEVTDDYDRTVFFVSDQPRPDGFTEDEHTFLRLIGQWITYELEQHHRERELEETVDRLERSNQRLEQFAYAASHDIQEPLRMVSSYLQLVESRADDELGDDTREYLQFAVDGADRMREMIEGLLEYSRVETRGDSFEAVDLEVVLGAVLDDLKLRVQETDARIDVGSLQRVEGDDDQLRQVLQNLVENALKYSGDAPPAIEVRAERVDGEVVVSVADEGPGIASDEQKRVFDVFERLHGREEHDGTGIGLALCERIVERHGGEIWIDSEPGEGTTVRFTLPAAE